MIVCLFHICKVVKTVSSTLKDDQKATIKSWIFTKMPILMLQLAHRVEIAQFYLQDNTHPNKCQTARKTRGEMDREE
jgi:hypothetical protein